MARIKTSEEVKSLRKGGKILARILRELGEHAKPGMSTMDINDHAIELAHAYGVEPVLLGYHPEFAERPYPAALCTSVNDTVQHGVPREDEILKEGDVLNLDMSVGYDGMIVDSGITVPIGEVDETSKKLMAVTKEALARGVREAKAGNRIGDISHAIQTYVEANGFSIVEVLCGHGVGHAVHEEPQIPNFGKAGTGPKIEVGNVFAIEPIVNAGGKDVIFDDDGDGYSVFTQDGSRSAHFEHTVVVTEKGPEVVTKE